MQRIERIRKAVEGAVADSLLDALDNASPDAKALGRTLSTATLINATALVHQTIRDHLSPKVIEMCSLASLKGDPRGLDGVLSSLAALLDTACLGQLSKHSSGLKVVEVCLFPEVVEALSGLKDLASPGNPALFHKRYLDSMKFLTNLERRIALKSSIDAFRESEDYKKFLALWNLPVYFQIRHQEIGLVVESSLCEEAGLRLVGAGTLPAFVGPDAVSGQVLHSTVGVLRGLAQCWQHDVYLPPLLHRWVLLNFFYDSIS